MASSPPCSQAMPGEQPYEQYPVAGSEFTGLPPIYVLPTHMNADDLHAAETRLSEHGAMLTYNVTEAKLVLTNVTSKKRIEYDLRTRRLWTKEVPREESASKRKPEHQVTERPRKRSRRLSITAIRSSGNSADISNEATDAETASDDSRSTSPSSKPRVSKQTKVESTPVVIHDSETESEDEKHAMPCKGASKGKEVIPSTPPRVDSGFEPHENAPESIRVLKLAWLEDSLKSKSALPIESYLVYEGIPISRPREITPPPSKTSKVPTSPPRLSPTPRKSESPASIMERARADVGASTSTRGPSHYAPAPHGPRRFRAQQHSRDEHAERQRHKEQLELLKQATSEFEGMDSDLPPPPEWVRKGWKYACQRSTPANPPNEAFIKELEKIKMARILTGDEIGVRAYNTSIASCRAYPYVFRSPREVLSLPGCEVKIANLWVEWKNTGKVMAAEEAEKDESLIILRRFYDIWGVGEKTAREFYYDKGWKDLDDVIEYGWNDLTRVQQIGVKFYEEFSHPIPRSEVEFIAAKVKEHAIRVRDDGIEMIIVGGYRRGKEENNDVDILVSHRDHEKTRHLAKDITTSLEEEDWITHTLLLTETTTDRGQSTLPFKAKGMAGHGFDSLDKSLVVWQDPNWPTKDEDLERDPDAKNPNIHRRVDIIVSPWKTVGCAALGWSGGTTFQRDVRRYAKNVKGWKFDSTGVRDRKSGQVMVLEGPEGVNGSMVDAEKKVFEGLGLVYREPWERCTG